MTAHLDQLLGSIQHRLLNANPRRPLREPGGNRDEALFVTRGILALYKIDRRGRQIVALRFAGEAILPSANASLGVQPLVPSEVASVIGVNSLLERRPDLSSAFLRFAQRDASIAHEWLVNNSRDCGARIAHLLCEIAIRGGYGVEGMPLPFTQQQIAEITGQTSVNVNRVFADLERQGLIARDGRDLRFLDWDELRRMASFQPEYLVAA